MTIDIQILQHKDCIHCFQPIDERAKLCPFCTMPQESSRKWFWPIVLATITTLVALAALLWALVDASAVNHRLADNLERTQSELNLSRTQADAEVERKDARLDSADQMVTDLLSKVGGYAFMARTLCSESLILTTCDEVESHSASDAVELARLMGVYESLSRKAAFCNRLRPVLKKLTRVSSTILGARVYEAYFLSTQSCWR